MNLTPESVPFLLAVGVEAVHWSNVGDVRATDEELMRWAAAESRVVFTNDLDFGALHAMSGVAGRSVIQVRAMDLVPEAIGADVWPCIGHTRKRSRAAPKSRWTKPEPAYACSRSDERALEERMRAGGVNATAPAALEELRTCRLNELSLGATTTHQLTEPNPSQRAILTAVGMTDLIRSRTDWGTVGP